MKAIDRFYMYLAEKSLKPTVVEKEIGLSNGYLSAQKKRGADIGEGVLLKIIDYFRDINPMWLLTGEGSMLRNDQVQPMPLPVVQVDSPSEAAIYYRMYKEKDEENKVLIAENATLKERFRQLESQDKEPDHHTKISEGLETFISDSSGGSIKDSLPTKHPTISKRLSGGKM